MSHMCDGRDLTCHSCVAMAKRHEVVRAALTIDDRLDDIARAQIWSRLESKLARRIVPRVWPARLAIGAAIAASVAIVVAMTRGGHDVAGRFVAPSETTLSLRLGHARASLVGPARLDVVDATPSAMSVRLLDGTLLAEFEGGLGRSLRITAPGATIEIVGTLFAVAVHAGTTCVSVEHGAVRMTTATRAWTITGGQRGCSDGNAPDALAPAMHDALIRHAQVVTAALDSDGVAPTAAVVAPVVAAPVSSAPVASAPAPSAPVVTAVAAATVAVPAAARAAIVARPAVMVARPAVTVARPAPAHAIAAPSPPPATPVPSPPSVPMSPPAPSPPPATASSPVASPSALATRPPPTTAATLYHDAEAALAARDLPAADHQLAILLSQFPESALLDQALYERARIAYRQRAWAAAQRQLDRLSTIQSSPLAEPGAYLSCRIAFEASDGGVASCLTTYRGRYPRSPHDADVLGMLADVAFRAGGCARARAGIAELTRRYPDAPRTQDWHRRCPETP